MSDDSPWMTPKDVTGYCQINRQTVDNWVAAGLLKKHGIGRVVRFHRDEVDAALMGEAR